MAHTSSNVEQAVVQFYTAGANPETHKWLTEAQMSSSAWSFAFELIDPAKKPEVQFFGASTVALKVARFWHEVPNEQYEELRNRIVQLMMSYRSGPHIVSTRLCVAMASLVIHSIPDKWANPVQEIIAMFQNEANANPQSTAKTVAQLFELLTVIPEEYSTLSMPTQKRSQVRQALANSLQHVLPLILQVLQQKNLSETSVQAIKSLQAWVQFGVPMEQMGPIIERLLVSVHDEEVFDCSLDALSSIVSHPDTHKYVNLLKSLLERILTLQPMLCQLINEGSYEMANPLVCLYVTFGECHSRMMIDWSTEDPRGKELVFQLLQVILAISSVPAQYPVQETISEMPFGFWYIFQDDIIACEPPQYDYCIATFAPIYQALVDALLRKSMYNLKESEWTPDQRESFRCYRTDIGDTIMYCFNLLRDNLLRSLLNHLDEATRLNQQNPGANWPYLEATLYMWSAVAESLAEEEEECPVLMEFLAKLPALPYNNNMRVISSALDCIGGFAEWLAMHPTLLPLVAPIVTSALKDPELALAATMALKDICRDCSEGMRPQADEVIAACNDAMRSNRLKPSECVRLMYSIGKMLSLMPPDQVLTRLEPILSPYLQEMTSLSSQPPSPHTKPKIDFIFKLLTTLFQSLESSQQSSYPVQVLFPQIYPLIKQLAQNWIQDPDVIECLCNLLGQCVQTLQDNIRTYAEDLVQLLMQVYETVPHSCVLDLARNFFVLYAKDDALRPKMQEFFKHLITRTTKEMGKSSNPSDYSDLIASFFCIVSQVIKKSPVLLTTEGVDLVGLFNAACGCLGLPENGPVKYSAQFLNHFIGISREHQALTAIVNQYGSRLFQTTMACIGGESARSFTDYYVDIIFALNKKYFDNLRQWLMEMVNADNFPTQNVTKEQKQQYANFVLKERANKRKLLEVTREFSLTCSGLVGTEYAMQMGQVMAAWDRIGMKEEDKKAAAEGEVC